MDDLRDLDSVDRAARRMFGLPRDAEPTPEQRTAVKTATFGFRYRVTREAFIDHLLRSSRA